VAIPLLGKYAYGSRAAAHPHTLLFNPIDYRRLSGLHHKLGAAFDGQLDRLLITQSHHHVARKTAFFFTAASKMMHPAQGKHLRTVLGRRDVSDDFPFMEDIGLLGPQVAVGVDFDLEAAIAEDSFG